MTNLNSRSALHPRYTTWAKGVLSAFQNCTVGLYDPNNDTNGDNWSPYAPGGTSAPTLLWQGTGQLSVIRNPLTVLDVVGSVDEVRSVRFEVPKDGPMVAIRRGLMLRVLACGEDPSLLHYNFSVTSGMNGSLSWMRTIEAQADQGVYVDPVS